MSKCGECKHRERCRSILGSDYDPESVICDWEPSRYQTHQDIILKNMGIDPKNIMI